MFLRTYRGIDFDFDNLNPEQVDIEDIAHSLSMQTRYGGHLPMHYSIAQHSVLCSQYPNAGLELLLHDATEAYVTDVPTPVKIRCPHFSKLEDEIWENAIAPKFKLPPKLSSFTKQVDRIILLRELHDLVGHSWESLAISYADDVEYARVHVPRIEPLSFDEAKQQFLNRFKELVK